MPKLLFWFDWAHAGAVIAHAPRCLPPEHRQRNQQHPPDRELARSSAAEGSILLACNPTPLDEIVLNGVFGEPCRDRPSSPFGICRACRCVWWRFEPGKRWSPIVSSVTLPNSAFTSFLRCF